MDDRRVQLLCAWALPLALICMFVGWWPLAGFFPPPLPSADANAIAALYLARTNEIRTGMIVIMLSGALFAPTTAVLYVQLRRIEGARSPVLTMTYTLCGAWNIAGVTIPAALWTAAAFRPDRNPEITQIFNDIGWVFWLMVVLPVSLQNCAMGVLVLKDKLAHPLFPRWWECQKFCV